MRLTLAAIFRSTLFSGLLNMKRFALEEDAGRFTLWEGGGSSATLLPFFRAQVKTGTYFYINIYVLESCGQVSATALVL